jgi:hypothetical protein
MKKLAVLFIVLLAAALPVMASDVTVSGELYTFAQYDFEAETTSGGFPKAELNVEAKVDEIVTVKLELDSEGTDWAGNVAVDDFRLLIDLGAALKLPVKVTWTVGYFDTYFTDWSYVSTSGWEFYYGEEVASYGWDNALANRGPDAQGAWQLDIGVGPVTLHWWNDFAVESMMVGVSGGFGPITGWLTYDDENSVNIFHEGVIGVELKYAGEFGDLKLAVPAFFRYNLLAETFTYGAGVAVDYTMFHVAAGLEGDDVDALDNLVFEGSVAPMEGLTAMVSAYMNLASNDAFSGLAIEVRKSLGAANFILGYMVGGEDALAIPVYGDNYYVANGLYMGFAVAY